MTWSRLEEAFWNKNTLKQPIWMDLNLGSLGWEVEKKLCEVAGPEC
jgi:hypothetical protein